MENQKITVKYLTKNPPGQHHVGIDECEYFPHIVTDDNGNMLFTAFGPLAAVATEAAIRSFEQGTQPSPTDLFKRIDNNIISQYNTAKENDYPDYMYGDLYQTDDAAVTLHQKY